jgi:hypothetical protein
MRRERSRRAARCSRLVSGAEEIIAQHGVPARLFLSVDSPAALAQVGALSPQEARAVRR